MAQGNMVVGGLGVSAEDGSRLTVNIPSAGRIPAGATVEREVATILAADGRLTFHLAETDVTTATLVAEAINREFAASIARAVDPVSIVIDRPAGAASDTDLMSRIENIAIRPADAPARVIVNSRTGTVVINGAVRIGRAAVSHGRLTVSVAEDLQVSQPAPFSGGETAVVPDSAISAEEEGSPMVELAESASLSDIVDAIRLIGAGPSDLVAILESLKQAGALRAELVVL